MFLCEKPGAFSIHWGRNPFGTFTEASGRPTSSLFLLPFSLDLWDASSKHLILPSLGASLFGLNLMPWTIDCFPKISKKVVYIQGKPPHVIMFFIGRITHPPLNQVSFLLVPLIIHTVLIEAWLWSLLASCLNNGMAFGVRQNSGSSQDAFTVAIIIIHVKTSSFIFSIKRVNNMGLFMILLCVAIHAFFWCVIIDCDGCWLWYISCYIHHDWLHVIRGKKMFSIIYNV